MITQADMNKVLEEVNRVLALLDKRITDLESKKETPPPTTRQTRKSNENT